MCIFCKIAAYEIKSDIVFENEAVIAFRDINPQAPKHIVVIPKEHIETLNQVKDFNLISEIYKVIPQVAMSEGIKDSGYRVVVNTNRDSGQEVYHIHFHILGGRRMHWPPG
ncbi:MAG: histidine triad nucleotide-binding protein [bacterium]